MSMTSKTALLSRLTPLLCSSFLVVSACGSAAGPSDGETYVTLRGMIESDALSITGRVRTAIVWENADAATVRISQELAVSTSFPTTFTLPLTALPPASAFRTADLFRAKYAIGTLVVYEDTNGNDQLDIVALDQPAEDRILGTLPDEALYYIDGTPPAPELFEGLQVAAGLNLVADEQRALDPKTACEPYCPERVTRALRVVPLEEPLAIQLTGSPQLARLLCGAQPGQFAEPVRSSAPSLPPPGSTVVCSADGNAYEYELVSISKTPCDEVSLRQGWGRRDASTAADTWPCP